VAGGVVGAGCGVGVGWPQANSRLVITSRATNRIIVFMAPFPRSVL